MRKSFSVLLDVFGKRNNFRKRRIDSILWYALGKNHLNFLEVKYSYFLKQSRNFYTEELFGIGLEI